MRVLIVSGIWPPDIGGPASHAPELAEYLSAGGHSVHVVTTAATEPAAERYGVTWVSRGLPAGARHLAVVTKVAAHARKADVVYATSMTRRAALGAGLAGRPLVLKLTSDEVYERERRAGRFDGDLDAFQHNRGGARVRFLRAARSRSARRAAHVFTPSSYLRDLAVGWGVPAGRITVSPNAAPLLPPLPGRDEIRSELGVEGPVLAFAGRLTAAKALDVALQAVALVPEVTFLVVGDGPDRAALERQSRAAGLDGRVRFLGGRPRDAVLRVLAGADAGLLSSRWENFPHLVVEALAVGTPMIATTVGGVPEIVRDGENGLLVPAGSAEELAAAIRRLLTEPGLRERLAAGAAPSVAQLAPERLLGEIEMQLAQAVQR